MAKKLIEVALPLDEINAESAREKSIRHGHPSTLHLWWARRPLAAARAVIFSSLITDPSDPEYPWLEGEEHDVEKERGRLHQLIAEMVKWENSNNEQVLARVHAEIHRHTNGNPPPLLDPFAGGGAIPLEAQRLGLEAHASDLNPVAVLINKAMIEIPPKFANMPPVNPERGKVSGHSGTWKGATGLADDVRYYGKWMRDEAEKRIGHLYPKVTLPKEQGGGEATVIAWLWARTVTCPNPACGAEMPLVSSYWLSKKKGKETWLAPGVDGKHVQFSIHTGASGPVDPPKQGRGARFACLVCGEVAAEKYIKSEGVAGRMSQRLLATVAEGRGARVYVPADDYQEEVALEAKATWKPTANQPNNPRWFSPPAYGLTTFGDLFTERQLVALTTFSDLVGEVREVVLADTLAAGRSSDETRLTEGGCGAAAYADAVVTYLGLGVSRLADIQNALCSWETSKTQVRHLFTKHAIPMIWDFAESNVFARAAGDYEVSLGSLVKVIERFPSVENSGVDTAEQVDATHLSQRMPCIISTDPPYYDNIGYADLSDFFYVWLRRSCEGIYPALFRSMLAPKGEELVATPYRFSGGKAEAQDFFEDGLRQAFARFSLIQDPNYPATIYYAFKQAEDEFLTGGDYIASTGWETMLDGLVRTGFQVTGTWPMRTELSNRMIASGTNALASSIVLACRVRPEGAPEATRQQFVRELRQKLADDLRPLQQSNIAPVDLAQAAIGPGMAIYSKYARVREASGEPLTVRSALALINQALDEVLAEQDEEYDAATRWAINWYESHGMNEGPYGDAEGYARARNVAVHDLDHDGIVKSARGKVRFVWREELPRLGSGWNPRSTDFSDWLLTQHLAQAVQRGQTEAAAVKARIDSLLPGRTEIARDLAYRLFQIADRKGWTREALVYNTLVQNWSGVETAADRLTPTDVEQQLTLLAGPQA